MKTKCLLALALLLSCRAAYSDTLDCTVKLNNSVDSEELVTVTTGNKTRFGKLDDFHFYLNSFGNHKFGVEAVDINAPSRSYAEGSLADESSELNWAFWSREVLVEA